MSDLGPVLLPVDLGHPASWEKALPLARHVAGGGVIHVLGIVHPLGASMLSAYLPERFEEDALERMAADLDAFVAAEADHGPLEPRIGHGHVPEAILDAAEAVDAAMIVMASHPPDELRTLLVASNATRVVRHATVPVLVVR